MQNKRMGMNKRILLAAGAVLLLFGACIGVWGMILPDEVTVFAGESVAEAADLPFVRLSEPTQAVFGGEGRSAVYARAELLGVLTLKDIKINILEEKKLYPGGMPFGVKLYTKGLLVVGFGEVDGENGSVAPGKEAGLQLKDIIEQVNGREVNTVAEFCETVDKSGGGEITLSVKRQERIVTLTLKPILSQSEGTYKAGIWVRDSTAGIGTVTYIDPSDLTFGGLGHGICDVDTGEIMPFRSGSVVGVTLNGIAKGIAGAPGELKGYFAPGRIGSLSANGGAGVFGQLDELPPILPCEPLPIALRRDIREGEAYIYCTVCDRIETFSVEIRDLDKNGSGNKNFVVKVTDRRLLDATGGIVQGMSGSPIIQDGKLIGAVTHVLINDPTKGYGIFIENMLNAAG